MIQNDDKKECFDRQQQKILYFSFNYKSIITQ
jgi:hypothetical protein